MKTADALEAELRAVGTTERAEGEKRYLKSDLEHLGANVWKVERVVSAYAREHPDLSRDELIDLAEGLWSKPIHERRAAAASLLELRADLLGPRDLKLLERLVRESRTWALVDGLAASVVGDVVLRYPKSAPRLDRWSRDPDFWVRRASLLAWLPAVRQGEPMDRFLGYADAMLDENEFFIRKAIGWVLREAGKTRPGEVHGWLAPRTDRASGVTVREAVKYLKEPQRRELLAAHKAQRSVA